MSGTARLQRRLGPAAWATCFGGILGREAGRFLQQRGRLIAALVRPLVWLFIFAAGFRSILGVSVQDPYETYILYQVYIAPGLVGMILLFSGMQGSLSMVYDREMGSMRVLLCSPMPRWFLLAAKVVAQICVAAVQVYIFLAIAWIWDVRPPAWGYLAALPAILLAGVMLSAIGLLLSSFVRQLENFAGVMNFVIFPAFFASSALYPLWRIRETSHFLYLVAQANPFTHAVELIRFALYQQMAWTALAVVAGVTVVAMAAAVWAYDPHRGLTARRGPAA